MQKNHGATCLNTHFLAESEYTRSVTKANDDLLQEKMKNQLNL